MHGRAPRLRVSPESVRPDQSRPQPAVQRRARPYAPSSRPTAHVAGVSRRGGGETPDDPAPRTSHGHERAPGSGRLGHRGASSPAADDAPPRSFSRISRSMVQLAAVTPSRRSRRWILRAPKVSPEAARIFAGFCSSRRRRADFGRRPRALYAETGRSSSRRTGPRSRRGGG